MAQLRDARDDDADALIALITAVFDEYPGCVMDVDGEMPELRAIATWFREHDGEFWVAQGEADDTIVGCVGYAPSARADGIELKKLYVARAARESGLGGKLVARVEQAAQQRGARFIDLWSDTRFETAHAFYERRGWRRTGDTRELHDKSETVEFYFVKPL